MKKYYCPKCEIEVSGDEVEATGESEFKGVGKNGVKAGMVYRHKKCGTIVRESE